jgi:hypothetical protein
MPLTRFLASLKLAVIVLLCFIGLMTWGTLVESRHNAAYAKLLVYQSPWFLAVLGLLFINVLFAALVRLPYKKRLTGFYIIHLGLLLLLAGSVITGLRGIDALIALESHEGEVESGSQRLGIRRLARPRLTLQQQRATQPQRQPADGREGIVGEIAGRTEPVGEGARVEYGVGGRGAPDLLCEIVRDGLWIAGVGGGCSPPGSAARGR